MYRTNEQSLTSTWRQTCSCRQHRRRSAVISFCTIYIAICGLKRLHTSNTGNLSHPTHAQCHPTQHSRFVFQHLPQPNRACLVGVYAFLIWNNLCDLVYQTPTKSYQSDSGSFRYTRSRDYQTPTRHALLGSGRCWKTNLLYNSFT